MERFFKRPWLIVAVIVAITVFFALQLPRAQLDNNNFRFVPEKDPARLTSKHIDDVFGSQIFIMVGLERRYGTVLDADFLKKLRTYGEKVKELPVVDSVTSIITTDYIGGSADGITVEPLVSDDFKGTQEEIAVVRDRLLEWDLYRRGLVSDDFKSTQVLVSLNLTSETAGTPESVEAYLTVKSIAQEMGFEGTRIYVTGMPVFSAVVNEATAADLRVLIPLVAIAVILVLFLSFRRIGGIVLPLLTVAISAIWAIGAMAFLGVKLSIISTVLPVILVAVGSAYGIHVVSHYYDEMAGRRNLSDEEHKKLIYALLRKVGRPVLLAALTTFAGFGSLCFTTVVPIFEFGIFSSFGVIVAFVVAMTLIPALFIIRGPAKPRTGKNAAELDARDKAEDPLSTAIADAFGAIARKRRSVIGVSLVVVGLSIFGITRVVIDNVMVEYFKSDTDVVKSDEFIRKYFGGSKTLSLVVRGEKPGDVLDPAVLTAMDGLSEYLAANVSEVGKTTSFTDLVKRINQVFNADESPQGLSRGEEPAPAPTAPQASDAAFGFGDDAGFGFSGKTTSAPEKPASVKPVATEEAMSKLKMVALLSEALAGGERDMSAEELVRRLAKETNYRGAAYYEIPADPARYAKADAAGLRALVSNYLVLLSGDIGAFADDPLEPKSIRMNLQLRTVGQRDTDRAIAAINEYVAERFPKNVQVEIGGVALVEESLNRLVVLSQLSSVVSSLLMVFLILAVYYRSAIAGLIGLLPLAISILINFGVMGAFGIKLNIGTAMVASIAVGIGIDYTIHYMAAYHHEYLSGKRGPDLLRRTFLTSGKAIIFNAASVGAGFAVLAFSQFNMLAYLGILITLTMVTSAAVSLTILPVLLETIQPEFIKRKLPFEKIQDVITEETK